MKYDIVLQLHNARAYTSARGVPEPSCRDVSTALGLDELQLRLRRQNLSEKYVSSAMSHYSCFRLMFLMNRNMMKRSAEEVHAGIAVHAQIDF